MWSQVTGGHHDYTISAWTANQLCLHHHFKNTRCVYIIGKKGKNLRQTTDAAIFNQNTRCGLLSARPRALGKNQAHGMPVRCRVSAVGNVLHSAKIDLCRVPRVDTRQRLNAVSHPNGRRTAGAHAGHVRGLCRVRARWHSAKSNGCRVPYFADGQLSAKLGHTVCHVFAECPLAGTRQRSCLPSARGMALGNGRDTWQRLIEKRNG